MTGVILESSGTKGKRSTSLLVCSSKYIFFKILQFHDITVTKIKMIKKTVSTIIESIPSMSNLYTVYLFINFLYVG